MASSGVGAVNEITLQQLKYFVEVAVEGSISAAADLLYVSQPTISGAMKDLEQRVGCTLFTRSARGVTLTEDGTEFLGYARQVVEQNLMIGLGGYTISTGIISDDLDPSIIAVPLDVDERIEVGWIGHASISLTEQAQRFVTQMRDVVSSFGVELLN